MSAYIVDRQHIVYMVSAAMSDTITPDYHSGLRWGMKEATAQYGYRHEILRNGDYEKAAEVANMLWMENIRSVDFRYRGGSSANLPGPNNYELITEKDFRVFIQEIELAQLFKSIDCYAYQTCEHDEWQESESFAFIQSLRNAAWHALPGYENASWGAPEFKTSRRQAA